MEFVSINLQLGGKIRRLRIQLVSEPRLALIDFEQALSNLRAQPAVVDKEKHPRLYEWAMNG